jgi:hypothetical protein
VTSETTRKRVGHRGLRYLGAGAARESGFQYPHVRTPADIWRIRLRPSDAGNCKYVRLLQERRRAC